MDEPKKKKHRKKKETAQERAERYNRENAEAKALGISYGKYSAMKIAGTLPENIHVPDPPKREKILNYRTLSRKEVAQLDHDAIRGKLVANQQEEAEMMETAIRGEFYAKRYMLMMRRHREAVQRIKPPEAYK